MVRISSGAVALLEESRREKGIPDDQGIRVYGELDAVEGMQVRLAFADNPVEGEEVIEQDGTEFYIAPEVVEPLRDTVVDVVDEGSPQLVLRPEGSEQ